jgi:hypothetical protein
LAAALRAPIFTDYSTDPGSAHERRIGDIAWREGAAGDWTVVVQDDALLVDGFREQVPAALVHAPQTGVSFYFGAGRPEAGVTRYVAARAEKRGASWIEWDRLAWGVAVAMPTAAVEDFLAWGAGSTERYDRRIGEFWREQRRPIRYTWPSLVDHDDSIPTLAQRRPAGVQRVAYRVGTRDSWAGSVLRVGANQGIYLSE